MARIIPGVQVSVVKEVVPPQLAPSGVLGLIGLTEKIPARTERASSWSSFLETFGSGTAHSIPEAKMALENGIFELVVVPLVSSTAANASAKLAATTEAGSLTLSAKALGPWANGYSVEVTTGKDADGNDIFSLSVKDAKGTLREAHKKLTTVKTSDRYVMDILAAESSILMVSKIKDGATLKNGEYKLAGGTDALPDDYDNALASLENEPDVDMVIASPQDYSEGNSSNITKIYSKVISHCERMSSESKGRIGFGQASNEGDIVNSSIETAGNLVSDRFVYCAPHGMVGALAGRVGSLQYFRSPTFKTMAGLGEIEQVLEVSAQRALLKNSVVPIVKLRGRGNIVLRGLTTDGDQISVRRVADRAVRGVKMLGDLFIGKLNTEDGRGALKQKLVEFLVQMERENAIVPSTDGTEPAFMVDVYSSQADFAKGIVRVDMAVRPVRAIDYIYATILVQV